MSKSHHPAPPDSPGITVTAEEQTQIDAAVQQVMQKYDRESNTRIWTGRHKLLVSGLLAAFSLYCIYDVLFSTGLIQQARLALFVGLLVALGYIIYPVKKGVQRENYMPWYDVVIMLVGFAAFLFFVVSAKQLIELRISKYRWYHIVAAVAAIGALVELCRRSVGLPILCVAGAFVIYALLFYQTNLDIGLRLKNLIKTLFYSTEGILSTPINVCAKYIVVFIIFGAFLERTGIADFFVQLANCAVGSASGGPAKVAVIASALEGMASGSSVANTVGSGSVTIPMMKKTGYKPEFAAAVEAAASTGGQIMPPIMGAAAFLMADFVGVPYSNIVVRAILPAVLYFAGIFISVHLEAKRLGLKGIPKELLPRFRQLVKKSILLLPIAALVILISGSFMTIQYAAVLSILCIILVSLFNKDDRINPKKVFSALSAGAQSSIAVCAACAMAGIVAGCITMTGLSSVLKSAIVTVSQGYPIAALFMTMLCCIVLGMGVPTTANYCIMASTCAPILVEMGIPLMAAHMFVFYFGIVADITPPVALAAYAGSAIAGSDPIKTALNATKLAVGAFIIPYIFALNPTMLFIGQVSVIQVVQIVVTSLVGMYGVVAGLVGYAGQRLHPAARILCIIAGLCLIIPGPVTDAIGIAILLGALFFNRALTKA